MSNISARLGEVHYRMIRAHSQEKARMEAPLSYLHCVYRLAPLMGGFGCLIPFFGISCHRLFVVEKTYILALIPLAAGVLLSMLAYAAHAWLSTVARRNCLESEQSMALLEEILAELEGFKPVVAPTQGIKIKRNRTLLQTRPTHWRILQWGQAWIVFSLLLYGILMLTPTLWNTPKVESPRMQSAQSIYRADLHPGIWVNDQAELFLGDGSGDFERVDDHRIGEKIQSINAENDRSWLIVADQNVKYQVVEDLMEQLRLAGIAKVNFMADSTY